MRQRRYDKITLDRTRAIKLDNGFLRVPARIARTGVHEYRKPDGSIERAFRPEEEVSKPESLATFDGVPFLNDHPYAEGGVVTAQNAKRLGVGFVMHPAYRDGFVEATILVEDAEMISEIEAGKLELSCGYFMDRDDKPGVAPDGQSYDFVQRNIHGNHVASVREGRAGPEVRIQLDAQAVTDSAYAVDFQHTPWFTTDNSGIVPKGPTMIKITIDSKETEVSEIASERIANEREAAAKALASVKAELEKAQAINDGLKEQNGKLEAALKEAPAKIKAELQAVASLTAQAKVLAPDVAVDGLDAAGIKRAVVAKLSTIKLDGKSDDYVSARFDLYVEQHEAKNPATEAAEKELNEKPVNDGKTQTAAEAKAKMLADFFNPSKDK